jgi:hypothetical protein
VTTPPQGSRSPSAGRPRFSRRLFLLALAGAAAAVALGAQLRARIHRAYELDESSGVGDLDEATLGAIAALGDVLMPSRLVGNPEAQQTMRDVAHELARDVPGYRLELDRAAALLDAQSRSRHGLDFATLPLEARRSLVDEILTPMLQASPVGRRLRRLLPGGQEVARLWRFVAQGLLVGFYSSPLGWRLVGYAFPPGACAGLADYQAPPQPAARS